MEKVSSDIYGSVGPATLHESRGQIRSERLPAMGLVSLPACPAAQANPPRPCSGLRLTRVDPSASPSASLRASAHRDDKKGCQRHKPPLCHKLEPVQARLESRHGKIFARLAGCGKKAFRTLPSLTVISPKGGELKEGNQFYRRVRK